MKKATILFLLGLTLTLSAAQHHRFYARLCEAAMQLTQQTVVYNPAYFEIKYPKGDIPEGFGVCTDVVIRAYRKLGIDLQQLVHEDMAKNFAKYPNNWGLKKPDSNIDHRRVPNLMVFFTRFGTVKPISTNATDYQPGDIVCWNLGEHITHIGIVVDKTSFTGNRHYIVHNIGAGQVMEDMLFDYKIIGHYSYVH